MHHLHTSPEQIRKEWVHGPITAAVKRASGILPLLSCLQPGRANAEALFWVGIAPFGRPAPLIWNQLRHSPLEGETEYELVIAGLRLAHIDNRLDSAFAKISQAADIASDEETRLAIYAVYLRTAYEFNKLDRFDPVLKKASASARSLDCHPLILTIAAVRLEEARGNLAAAVELLNDYEECMLLENDSLARYYLQALRGHLLIQMASKKGEPTGRRAFQQALIELERAERMRYSMRVPEPADWCGYRLERQLAYALWKLTGSVERLALLKQPPQVWTVLTAEGLLLEILLRTQSQHSAELERAIRRCFGAMRRLDPKDGDAGWRALVNPLQGTFMAGCGLICEHRATFFAALPWYRNAIENTPLWPLAHSLARQLYERALDRCDFSGGSRLDEPEVRTDRHGTLSRLSWAALEDEALWL